MTKLEMAEILVSSPAWDGLRNPYKLAKNTPKDILKDYYDMLEVAEEEYYNDRYC